MHKQKIIKVCFFIAMIAFNVCLSSLVQAEDSVDCADCQDKDGATQTPTTPGNAEYPPSWYCTCDPYIPLEFDPNNPDEITCGADIEISIIEGCPPFIWEVSDNGYTLTEIDERNYTLSCTGGTCGQDYGAVATVTVTDSCDPENPIVAKIRNKVGTWVRDEDLCGSCCPYNGYLGDPVGQYRYGVVITNGGTSGAWDCYYECANYVLSHLTSLGFPNSDGYSFDCEVLAEDWTRFEVTLNDEHYSYARNGWAIWVYRDIWSCP